MLTASDGQKDIELFRRECSHVTILNFEMPDMDGLTMLREIRTVDQQAAVIMLIGAGSDAREKQVRALDVTEFLAKEYSLHELGAAPHPVLLPPD